MVESGINWEPIDEAVKRFFAAYPEAIDYLKEEKKKIPNEYGLALEGDLKKAEWRLGVSFPSVIHRKDGSTQNLLPVIQRMFKAQGHAFPDEDRLYRAFMRRYPIFVLPQKV